MRRIGKKTNECNTVNNLTRNQWLMPVNLATQEAGRIEVQSQPGASSSRDPISKKPITKKGW
jgi:hypothetical protein